MGKEVNYYTYTTTRVMKNPTREKIWKNQLFV